MKNIISLSLLNIKRDKSKIKIYIIIMTIFISLINILLNTSIILNESINSIYINKKNIYVDYEMITTVKDIINSLILLIILLTFSKFNIHNNFINIMCVYLAPLINIYFIIYISSFNAFRKLKKIQISTLFREK